MSIDPKAVKRAKLIRLLHSPIACGELDFADFELDELQRMRLFSDDQWVNFATSFMKLDDAKLLHQWLKDQGGPAELREALDEEIEDRKNQPPEDDDDLGFGQLAKTLEGVDLG